MADTLTLYKLIVLKMLDQVDSPLSNSQISEFILDKEYTNYFTLQQVLSEMDETGLVTVSTSHNSSLYHITDIGKSTLEFFGDKISDAICRDIDIYLEEKEVDIRNSLAVTADYFPGSSNDYLVRCQVREENSTLIDLTLSVPSEKQAVSMCNHWSEKSQDIYAYIMKNLL
ncbi:MAG: DUF4364 family protein [Clostridiales bacterium]|nr:DUF4364 family protein [Clostridiales bacterium]